MKARSPNHWSARQVPVFSSLSSEIHPSEYPFMLGIFPEQIFPLFIHQIFNDDSVPGTLPARRDGIKNEVVLVLSLNVFLKEFKN